ncbi:hypothetical protein BDAP_000473 [Binucleata daphniae]
MPANHFIDDSLIFDQTHHHLYDIDCIRTHLKNEGRFTISQLKKIFAKSAKILQKEKNLVMIDKKTTIIGDIHGQFYDLLTILSNFDLERNTLLFTGDYVDRGQFSTEVYFYLLVLKIRYPFNIYILRGNHETEKMTRYFTYKNECKYKYNEDVFYKSIASFQNLPLAAVVMNKLYCAHGGISPSIIELKEINKIDRYNEPPYKGAFCDILWSDPHPAYDTFELSGFTVNLQRNCSWYYTYYATVDFLKRNNLMGIVRGHEVQNDGYRLYKAYNHHPSIVTIFSAPNYCDAYKNDGAFLYFDGEKIHITKFKSTRHPFYLPNYLDGINWCFPFICEKVSEFLTDLLKYLAEKGSESSTSPSKIDEQIEMIENFTGSMAIMRNERECTTELENEESSELPCCRLKESDSDLCYEEAKEQDIDNEKIKRDAAACCKGSSIDLAPSSANEVSKLLQNVNLQETIKDAQILVNDKKNVLEVKIKSKKKKTRNTPFFCFWNQD